MYVLGMVDVPEGLRERLEAEFSEEGTVGRIHEDGEHAAIGDDVTLSACGTDTRELLDILAPRCTYALVDGPTNGVGTELSVVDGMIHCELLEHPLSIDEIDISSLVEAMAESEPYVTLEALVEEIKSHPNQNRSGAIATFTGRVRVKESRDDTATEYLEFERYGDVAWETMEAIREELCERDDVFEVLMHHRTGVLTGGEDIVFVVVLAGHREQAFRTVRDGINRLKAEVPIFKKEVTVDEEFWVHNRP